MKLSKTYMCPKLTETVHMLTLSALGPLCELHEGSEGFYGEVLAVMLAQL